MTTIFTSSINTEVAVVKNKPVTFDFDLAKASVARVGSDLVVSFEEGGAATLKNFFVVEEGASLPDIVLADGTLIDGPLLLKSLNPDMDVSTEAGRLSSQPQGGGMGAYDDAEGSLMEGVDTLTTLSGGEAFGVGISDSPRMNVPFAGALAQGRADAGRFPAANSNDDSSDLDIEPVEVNAPSSSVLVALAEADAPLAAMHIGFYANGAVVSDVASIQWEIVDTMGYFDTANAHVDAATGLISISLTEAGRLAQQESGGQFSHDLTIIINGSSHSMHVVVTDQTPMLMQEEDGGAQWYTVGDTFSHDELRADTSFEGRVTITGKTAVDYAVPYVYYDPYTGAPLPTEYETECKVAGVENAHIGASAGDMVVAAHMDASHIETADAHLWVLGVSAFGGKVTQNGETTEESGYTGLFGNSLSVTAQLTVSEDVENPWQRMSAVAVGGRAQFGQDATVQIMTHENIDLQATVVSTLSSPSSAQAVGILSDASLPYANGSRILLSGSDISIAAEVQGSGFATGIRIDRGQLDVYAQNTLHISGVGSQGAAGVIAYGSYHGDFMHLYGQDIIIEGLSAYGSGTALTVGSMQETAFSSVQAKNDVILRAEGAVAEVFRVEGSLAFDITGQNVTLVGTAHQDTATGIALQLSSDMGGEGRIIAQDTLAITAQSDENSAYGIRGSMGFAGNTHELELKANHITIAANASTAESEDSYSLHTGYGITSCFAVRMTGYEEKANTVDISASGYQAVGLSADPMAIQYLGENIDMFIGGGDKNDVIRIEATSSHGDATALQRVDVQVDGKVGYDSMNIAATSTGSGNAYGLRDGGTSIVGSGLESIELTATSQAGGAYGLYVNVQDVALSSWSSLSLQEQMTNKIESIDGPITVVITAQGAADSYALYAVGGVNLIQGNSYMGQSDRITLNGDIFAQDGIYQEWVGGKYVDQTSQGINRLVTGEGDDVIMLNGKVTGSLDIDMNDGFDVLVLQAPSLDDFREYYADWLGGMTTNELQELHIESIQVIGTQVPQWLSELAASVDISVGIYDENAVIATNVWGATRGVELSALFDDASAEGLPDVLSDGMDTLYLGGTLAEFAHADANLMPTAGQLDANVNYDGLHGDATLAADLADLLYLQGGL